jgi:hypothetical protein
MRFNVRLTKKCTEIKEAKASFFMSTQNRPGRQPDVDLK